MRFEEPQLLYLLFALPALALFLWWAHRRRRVRLERFADAALVERLTASVSSRKRLAKSAGLVVAAGLIVFALARPQWGDITRPIEKKGVDLIVALDTSRSMLARDVPPNRLERAKRQLRGLLHRERGDRVGILAFAGAAFMQCPLTLDYGLAMDILDTIDVNAIPTQGTAIGTAIRSATEAFDNAARGRRALVLLTDGEDQGTEPLEAAREAAEKGVIIYAIGIGSRDGNPIPEGGSHKIGPDGNPVNTRLDAETLQKIALMTGGKYVEAKPSGELELDEIYASIDALEKTTQEERSRRVYEDRFMWFLLAAALILVWEILQNDRRKTTGEWAGRFH